MHVGSLCLFGPKMSEQSPVQPLAQRDKNRGHPHPPAKPILREEDRATPHTAKQLRERRRLIEMKIQEENVKLMQTFQTILSSEICIMIPAMAGIVNYERFDENKSDHDGSSIICILLPVIGIGISRFCSCYPLIG